LSPGFGPVTVRASLPVLTTGALFAGTGFFSTGFAGACCWTVLTGCCSWCAAFFAGTLVSKGFLAATVGVVVAWGFGTPGVCDAGFVSAVAGRDGLRPRLWDGEATGVVVAGEDPGFSEGCSFVEATTGGCWGFASVEPTRPAAAIAARTSARKSTTGLVEATGLATGAETGGTTGVILASTTGRWGVVDGIGVVWTTGVGVGWAATGAGTSADTGAAVLVAVATLCSRSRRSKRPRPLLRSRPCSGAC